MYQRISDLRNDNDLTQEQVAKILNMSRSGYAKYEVRENVPIQILIKLADLYDVSIDYMVGRTDNPQMNKK